MVNGALIVLFLSLNVAKIHMQVGEDLKLWANQFPRLLKLFFGSFNI